MTGVSIVPSNCKNLYLPFLPFLEGTVTVAHFAEFYLMRGVSVGDTMDGANITSLSLAGQALWRSTAYFVDLSLHGKAALYII